MKKYTHVECLEDVIEDDIVIFKVGNIYKITGFDYQSLVYYIEPEFYENESIPDEFAIPALSSGFQFLIIK